MAIFLGIKVKAKKNKNQVFSSIPKSRKTIFFKSVLFSWMNFAKI
jgi:hypothetical protein